MLESAISSYLSCELREDVHYGPVTALKILDPTHVLVGYGPSLKLYYIDSVTLRIEECWKLRVFDRNKIHCISVSDDKSTVAVAGGRSFALVPLYAKFCVEKAINEWIVAVDNSLQGELLLLTSHNEVLRVIISADGSYSVSSKVHCNEKSILYSGSIQRAKDGKVYIAAGTVMNGVIIWDLQTKKPLYTFNDHEGSIFVAKFDQDCKYITTCSDDRSIKLYDLSSGELLATGWGHGSRIWSLSICDISSSTVTIFSTGEDCSARLWSYHIGSKVLKQLKSFDNCHEGKHIWSGDANLNTMDLLVTGGADGKIRLLPVRESTKTVINCPQSLGINSLSGKRNEVVKNFALLPSTNTSVILTSSGNMFYGDGVNDLHPIPVSENYKKKLAEFSALHTFDIENYVIACSRSGDTLLLGFDKNTSDLIYNRWISDHPVDLKKIINALSTATSKNLFLLMVSPIKDAPFFVKKFRFENNSTPQVDAIELLRPDPRVFVPTTIFFYEEFQWLLVGSRHSNFAIYDCSNEENNPPYVIWKLCPGDTVTSITHVHAMENAIIVLVTVRDGIYLFLKVAFANGKFSHEVIHQNKFCKGFVEGGFYQDNQLFLYGFRSGAFYLWNETKQVEIDQEYCGGAHRKWEFSRAKHDSRPCYYFSYLKDSCFYSKPISYDFDCSPQNSLLKGTHGREIRDIAICSETDSDGCRLLASASEDATVKIGYLTSSCEIDYRWTMSNHVSGLQRVRFLNGNYFASSAANEELILWKLNHEIPYNFSVVEHARIPIADSNPDLRVMDFASIDIKDAFIIVAVFSNSQIKLLHFDKQKKSFRVVSQTFYGTFCILNVELISLFDNMYAICGTTDGFITVWDLTEHIKRLEKGIFSDLAFGKPVLHKQLHQSGVKALELVPCGDASWHVVTGGDDNALVSSILFLENNTLVLDVKSVVEKAASATITGISQVGKKQVLVTSVDQIVRIWDFSDALICLDEKYTTVADTGCCASIETNGEYIGIVGGAGISTYTIICESAN